MALNSSYGYDFHILWHNIDFVLPVTPSSLKTTSGSNNEVVNLINQGDINILKSPPLTEYEFTAIFPMRQYPYSRLEHSFKWYFEFFSKMKEEKGVFRFVIYRQSAEGNKENESVTKEGKEKEGTIFDEYWDTNVLVTCEEMTINEDASNGDDVYIDFKFKQFKEYNLVPVKDTSLNNDPNKTIGPVKYVIKRHDTLQNIANYYGVDPMDIYNDNKDALNQAVLNDPYWQAKGQKDCMGGALLIVGTEITINDVPKDSPFMNMTNSLVIFSQKKKGILNVHTAEPNKFGKMTEHRIKAGDTLTGIAIAYYGDANKWSLIYDANKSVILNKDSLKSLAGEVITIPRDK